MKNRLVGIAALSAMLVTGSAWGSDDANDRCQEWAKEDGVAAEEMTEYMAQCLEELRIADSSAGQEPTEEKADNPRESNTND